MQKIFIVQHQLPEVMHFRFSYVVDFINKHPLKPVDLLLVIDNDSAERDLFYGKETGNFFTVCCNPCFLDSTRSIASFNPTHLHDIKNQHFISVGEESRKKDFFFEENHFNFDVFNTIFFHISRYEEYFASDSDNGKAGWLREDLHFLVKQNQYQHPIVDRLITAFFKVISRTEIVQKSTYTISHDVDILMRFSPSYKFLKSLAATILKRRDWSQFQESIQYYRKMLQEKEKDPYNYFHELLRQEDEWKDKKIFIMAGGTTKYDNKYQLDDPLIKEIIQIAQDRGYSIGLHPSYNAGFMADAFEGEQHKLATFMNHDIIHNRQHWLRWFWKTTPYLLEKNGILTDSTMGFSHHLGFRCGTGFPYKMYDFKNEKAFSWTEHPMAFMESSAIHHTYSTDNDLSKLMHNFLFKNRYNSHLMLNFHNSNFDPLLKTGRQLRYFYEHELISLCFS